MIFISHLFPVLSADKMFKKSFKESVRYLCQRLSILALLIIEQSFAGLEARSDFIQSGCACLGHPLMFHCSTVGGGTTVWQGSAFNCPLSSDEIHLLHSQFQSRSAVGNCNGGAIIGQALRIEEPDCFISQLTITNVTISFSGKRIECWHDNGRVISIINMTEIAIIDGPPPPPTAIYLMNINKHQMTFSWNPVRLPNCQAIHYTINATNCGKCPSTTNVTTIACTELPISDESVCKFAVQSVICSDVLGPLSNTTTVTLKVPRVSLLPSNITATYSSDNGTLIKLDTIFTQSIGFAITEEFDGSVDFYNITYLESTSGTICGSATIPAYLCDDDICSHSFQVSSSPCYFFNDINVTVFATNVLGNGTSVTLSKGGINNFVNIIHDFAEGTVTCRFLFHSNGNKLCNITYFRDGCQQSLLTIGGKTDNDSITLQLTHQLMAQLKYCFIAKASNISTSVTIEGTVTYQDYVSIENNAVVVAIAITITALLIVMIVITLAGLFYFNKSKFQYAVITYKKSMEEENNDANSPSYLEIQKMNTVDNTDNDYHCSENNSDDESSDEMISYKLLKTWNTCAD